VERAALVAARTHDGALVTLERLQNDRLDLLIAHAQKLLAGVVQHVRLLALHLDLRLVDSSMA
jgi:hypothetical protein